MIEDELKVAITEADELKKLLDDGVLVRSEDLAVTMLNLADLSERFMSLSSLKNRIVIKEDLQIEFPAESAGIHTLILPTVAPAGLKYDSAKPNFSLLSPIALTYLVQVLTVGAEKYSEHNWRAGISTSRLLSATLRHLVAIMSGIDKDEETGLPHAAHAMCSLMFLLELSEGKTSESSLDDRFPFDSSLQDLLVKMLAGK